MASYEWIVAMLQSEMESIALVDLQLAVTLRSYSLTLILLLVVALF